MKVRLYKDLRQGKMETTYFSGKSLVDIGEKVENYIDTIPQEERKNIYCFTLSTFNEKDLMADNKTLGRWRPYYYNENIVFSFSFGERS